MSYRRALPHPRPGPILALIVLLTPACGGGEPAPAREDTRTPSDTVAPTVSVPAPVEDPTLREAVVAQASPVAGALMQTLSGQLRAAMDERGVVGAMEFCNVEALPLTREVEEERGMEVKRTSLRLRNPENAPDAAESRVLALYREAGSALPRDHVQALPDGSYRYYQPLFVADFCLQCHGDAEDLAPGVAEALRDLYPGDRATGYDEGDWRGLVRVTVPAGSVEGG